MNRNEKILAGVLGVCAAGYFLRGPVAALTVDPVRELEETRDDRFAESEKLSDEKFRLIVAKQRVDANRARSLPADVSDAERLYPQWLADLAALSGFSEVQTTVLNVGSKRGEQFRPVRVNLKGRARTDELDAFLRRFAATDLLHRVNRANASSPSPTGDVDLTIDLEAEAVSLPTATDRNALFPLAELAAPLPADAVTAEVTVPTDVVNRFPAETPFAVRAGREFLTVTAVDRTSEPAEGRPAAETWTLARGADGTDPEELSAGSFLQLWPTADDAGATPALSETGPFRKPRTYEPRLNLDGPTRLVRGDTFRLKATAVDFDERAGDAAFAVADAPAGFALDAATGEMTWDPPAELPAGDYPVTLTAALPKPDVTLTEPLKLTLAERNTAPTLAAVDAQAVAAGDVLLFDVTAGDAESPEGVTLSLVDPPAGATVDADFGVVRWAVPEDADLGNRTLTVRATDDGDPPLTADAAVAVEIREDLRPFVRLTGITGKAGVREAMFSNQAENKRGYFTAGDAFAMAGVSGTIRDIQLRTLRMERNERLYELELGQSLTQARDVGPAVPPAEGEEPVPGASATPGEPAVPTDAVGNAVGGSDADETASDPVTE